jgi:hypothetical protein
MNCAQEELLQQAIQCDRAHQDEVRLIVDVKRPTMVVQRASDVTQVNIEAGQ